MWSEVVLLVIVVGISGCDGGIFVHPPHSIDEKCSPDICDADGVSLVTDQQRQDCCHKCSCDPETCGRHRNCCYDYHDKYNITKDMLCVRIEPFAMYMVSTCGSDRNGLPPPLNQQGPVSSESTRRAYINAQTAECNNVTDYTVWDLRMVCPDMVAVMQEAGGQYKICSEHHVPPQETFSWLKYFICDNSIISDCGTVSGGGEGGGGNSGGGGSGDSGGFDDISSSGNQRINEGATATGCPNIWDPYFIEDRFFRNGHCAACTGIYSWQTQYKGNCGTHYYDPFFYDEFSVFVSEAGLESYRTALNEETSHSCDNQHIGHPNLVGCRRILCPEGMARVEEKCEYFLKDMYMTGYLVLKIRLYSRTSNDTLKREDLDRLKKYEKQHPTNFIRTSCTLISAVDVFSYELTNLDGETVIIEHILISGQKQFLKTKLEMLVNETRVCTRSFWKLIIAKKEFEFVAKIDDTIGEVAFDGIHEAENNTPRNGTNKGVYRAVAGPMYMSTVNPRQTELGEGGLGGRRVEIRMTELHFCEQVAMHPDEVEIRSNRNQVKLKHNDVVLMNGQFMILYKGQDEIAEPFRIKVCVDKFYRKGTPRNYRNKGTTIRRLVHVYYMMLLLPVMM